MQFVLEIFEIFCRDTLYMYLEWKLFFTKIMFLVQDLCPKNRILMNFGQLGQPKNFLFLNFFELDFFS
jgi:hypothetical protein